MSLNQKYTWADFLRENPEIKTKKVKRTSSEGKKAFEAAYKAKIKEVLKDRLARVEKETGRIKAKRETLATHLKSSQKAVLRRRTQSKIGTTDKYLSRLTKLTSRTKQLQKDI